MRYNESMHKHTHLLAIFIAIFFFTLYAFSTSATPTGIADADELTLTSYFLSVPHPPGFPLFTLVGHFFIKLLSPIFNPAQAANLTAALYQALAVTLLFLTLNRLNRSILSKNNNPLAPLATTMLVGTSYFVWHYATIYEVTAFTALLAAATLYSAICWHTETNHQKSQRYYPATWIIAGLLLSHFHLAFLYFPALLWLVTRKKTLSLATIFTGISLLIASTIISSSLLFLLNPNAPGSWLFTPTLSGWWHHLTRQDYVGYDLESDTAYTSAFAIPNLLDQVSLGSILHLFSTLFDHFGLLVIILIILGGWHLWRQHLSYFWFLFLLFLFSGPLLAAYIKTTSYTTQINLLTGIAQRQFILAEIAIGFFILPGIHYLLNKFKLHYAPQVLVVIILCGYQIYLNASLLTHESASSINYTYQRQRLQSVDPDALIICSTDIDCYTLWYLNYVEHVRPDTTILSHVSAYSDYSLTANPQLYPFLYKQPPYFLTFLIAHNLNHRPIYLSSGLNFYDQYLQLENGPLYLIPSQSMLKVSTKFPTQIEYSPLNLPLTPIDRRNLYSRGIIEAIANQQAYAGYLAIKYNHLQTAEQYLSAAVTLDPFSSQTQELIRNQAQISQLIAISDRQLTAQKLIDSGLTAENQNQFDTADQFFRLATLISLDNPALITQIEAFYQRSNDTPMLSLLHQSLIYNNPAPE
jgi:hypothetical protein